MPVARGPQINARSAVLVGLTGVIVALLLGGMVFWIAGSTDAVELNLGDKVFDAGFIGRQSDEIADRGPILYADAGSSRQRYLYLQHIGEDPEVGWLAFSARRIGDPRNCFATWIPEQRIFELVSSSDEACEAASFDELGCGLFRYPVGVIDGRITVFLNEDFDEVAEILSNEDSTAAVGPDLGC